MGLVSRSSSRNYGSDPGIGSSSPSLGSKSRGGNGLSGNVFLSIGTSRLVGAVCAGNVLSSLILFSLLRTEPCKNPGNHVLGIDYDHHPASSSAATSSQQQLRGSNIIDSNGETTRTKKVWSDFKVHEMKRHLQCSEFYQRADQTIHDQDAWKQMRKKYVEIVGGTESTIGPPESGYNGFSRPYYVGHNKYGRGIYAKADIPKGSLVWHNIRSAAFSEGMQFREFVMSLPQELGCDVLQWSYVMGEKIYCDLDEGSFCNNGSLEDSTIDIDETASENFIAKAGMQLFATRDIKKEEELLCNYSSFAEPGSWRLFGL